MYLHTWGMIQIYKTKIQTMVAFQTQELFLLHL